ncbi:MAG: hypothetical protein FWE37_00830 [Spirochaetaceae bacterium]|nr:hypothetical protein [Spirochaetaceae bacterium]
MKKVDSFNLKDLAISVITYAEIVFGLKKKGSKILYDHVMSLVSKLPVIYIDENTAEEYAAIRLDNMDMMIAELQ